ncbi:MAG: hypothetical protein HY646_08380 [Acidobacteria bacterium]|nr:hypothetical protein [Acidobacteriota bacterium]
MKSRPILLALFMSVTLLPLNSVAQRKHENAIIDLWAEGKTAFGVYVPSEGQPLPSQPAPQRGGRGERGERGERGRGQGQRGPQAPPRYTRAIGEALAKNPLYDFVFLNLEGAFSIDAVKAINEGLRAPGASSRKTLIVRIPPIGDADPQITKDRVKASFDAGADAVTIPHVEGLEQAKLAISFFAAATNNIWTPDNPAGEKLGMIMIEDPQTLTVTRQIAELKGYSMLACGVGSIGGAFRAGGVVAGLQYLGLLTPEQTTNLGELATARVLEESKRTKLANMITAGPQNLQQRLKDGFQALLFSGAGSDDLIRQARAASGR